LRVLFAACNGGGLLRQLPQPPARVCHGRTAPRNLLSLAFPIRERVELGARQTEAERDRAALPLGDVGQSPIGTGGNEEIRHNQLILRCLRLAGVGSSGASITSSGPKRLVISIRVLRRSTSRPARTAGHAELGAVEGRPRAVHAPGSTWLVAWAAWARVELVQLQHWRRPQERSPRSEPRQLAKPPLPWG
jgi:hypothetical protein